MEAHSKGRIKFVDCRSFFLSESEDIDEELMPDSAYPNASGKILSHLCTLFCLTART